MIRVLVADDSSVAREFLSHLINGTPGMQVVGAAADGREAVELTERLRPDIITMDITMPRMSGREAIERIMQTVPTPIVVVTSNTITEELRATFQSLESGALAIVPRPHGIGTPEHEADTRHLLETLRLMAEIKVVRRIPRAGGSVATRVRRPGGGSGHYRVVAIGASTGGPAVLKTLLAELPADFGVPVLVVQHIAAGFVDGFALWLQETTALTVRLAREGELVQPGVVYLAPDEAHLGVDRQERITLLPEACAPRLTGIPCPSAHHLFERVLLTYGAQSIGVLLTGMGRDGAESLLKMRRAGAMTIAQDKESSVVHGMPGEAIALGAADFVLPPARIAELLNLCTRPARKPPVF